MRHNQLIFCAALFFGLGLTGLQAQETTSASGFNASVSGQGSVSWSVGQVVFTTNTGTTGSLSQGVQQSFEISAVSGIEETKNINLMFSAYPNPTSDYLKLRIDNFEISDLSFQLLDTKGKLLRSEEVSGTETSIDMSKLVPAIYYLKVTENNKELKIFKIIKN